MKATKTMNKYYFTSFAHRHGFGNCVFETGRKMFYIKLAAGQIELKFNCANVVIINFIEITKKQYLEHGMEKLMSFRLEN